MRHPRAAAAVCMEQEQSAGSMCMGVVVAEGFLWRDEVGIWHNRCRACKHCRCPTGVRPGPGFCMIVVLRSLCPVP